MLLSRELLIVVKAEGTFSQCLPVAGCGEKDKAWLGGSSHMRNSAGRPVAQHAAVDIHTALLPRSVGDQHRLWMGAGLVESSLHPTDRSSPESSRKRRGRVSMLIAEEGVVAAMALERAKGADRGEHAAFHEGASVHVWGWGFDSCRRRLKMRTAKARRCMKPRYGKDRNVAVLFQGLAGEQRADDAARASAKGGQ